MRNMYQKLFLYQGLQKKLFSMVKPHQWFRYLFLTHPRPTSWQSLAGTKVHDDKASRIIVFTVCLALRADPAFSISSV